MKTKIALAAAAEPKPMPIKDWFTAETYGEIKQLAKFVIASHPDSTPRSAAHDLINGKYSTQKEVNADVKILSDYAIVMIRNLRQRAK